MSVEVCRVALLQPFLPEVETEEYDEQKQIFDIWSSIQKNNENIAYVHPLVRQSSSLMSQNSLEICTESLGSETGTYELSGEELDSPVETGEEGEEEEEEEEYLEMERKELSNVNYHCSIGRRSPARSFPPPLPSISRRDGFCFKMQPHRHNGRLVLESVHVPSHNYLHAERHGGRLLLSFIETGGQTNSPVSTIVELEAETEKEEEEVLPETEEEEVEVVNRGTVVEVKISTPAAAANGAVMRRVHVINKFIVGSPLHGSRWMPLTPAAAAASDSKLLFTSKRRSRDELLNDMRRCSELRRLLFIFEQPYCIATS